MSVQSEIDRINENVANTYTALSEMGATMPEAQTTANLAETVGSIKSVKFTEQTLTDDQKAQARTNIGAAASSHNHSATNINSGTLNSDRLPTVPVAKGGTGATDAATARTNLEITPANIGAAESSHNHKASNITSGTLSSSRLPTVPITKGGTGATDAATARTNLEITPANIGAFATDSIITFYNVSLTVSSGVGTYSNSNIKSSSRCFCQRRVGSYMSGIQMVSGTTSNNGSVTVAFDTSFNSNVNINLIVINS